VISRAVDRFGDLRSGLIAAVFASAAGFAIVGFAYGFIPILLTMALASVAWAPIMSLADAYAVRGLNARRRAYGPVRLWGSAAFIAANCCTGFLLTVMATDKLVWLIVASLLLTGCATLWLPKVEPAPLTEAVRPRAEHLWRSPQFLAVAGAASLIQASHALYYGFSAVDWTAKGLSSTTVGLLWALGVLAEIVLFALSGRLTLNPTALVAIGAASAVVRWIVMAFDPAFALLPIVQCLHGLSFGATHLGAIQFVAQMASNRRAAAAQGDFATILAIGGAATAAASGLLYDALGDRGYAVMAAMAVLGGACLIVIRPARGEH
jgi:MFS transporter, PPP family, 3-phenylpropionic acid transporter